MTWNVFSWVFAIHLCIFFGEMSVHVFLFLGFFFFVIGPVLFVSLLLSFDRIPLLDMICKHLPLSLVCLFILSTVLLQFDGVHFMFVLLWIMKKNRSSYVRESISELPMLFEWLFFYKLYHTVLIIIALWQVLKSSMWFFQQTFKDNSLEKKSFFNKWC